MSAEPQDPWVHPMGRAHRRHVRPAEMRGASAGHHRKEATRLTRSDPRHVDGWAQVSSLSTVAAPCSALFNILQSTPSESFERESHTRPSRAAVLPAGWERV